MATFSTFKELQDHVMSIAGMSGTSDREIVKDALNDALQDFWVAKPWVFRKAEGWAATKEPYSTGTVEATAANQLTLTGGTWPTDIVGMKVGVPGLSSQWYRVTVRDSGSVVTVDRNIPNYATLIPSGTSYYAYADRVDLSAYTDIDVLMAQHVYLHDTDGRGNKMRYVSEEVAQEWGFPRGAGRPVCWTDEMANTLGTRNIRVGPLAPNTTYQIHFFYFKAAPTMSSDLDEPQIPARMRGALVPGALRRVYQMDEYRDTNLMERATRDFERAIKKAASDHATYPRRFNIRPFDNRRLNGGIHFTIET